MQKRLWRSAKHELRSNNLSERSSLKMDYLNICPRCKFKVSATKHFCPTCGLKMQPGGPKQEKPAERSIVQPAPKSSFWANFFSSNSRTNKEVDQTQEKPAW
jgi:predicted amidophosphoribosyltransferase